MLHLNLKLLAKALKKKQSKAKNDSGRFGTRSYSTWHNLKLGSKDGINKYNKWYGDKAEFGENTCTLLFPTASAYKCKAKTMIGLSKIILDDKNWTEYVTDDSGFTGGHVYQEDNAQIKHRKDYYEYLKSKGKIK